MQKKTTTIPINRIFQRLVQEHPVATNQIRSPRDGADIVKELISDADREHFVVLSLNNKHEVTSIEIAHTGSLNTCIVHPREVFKNAILSNAAAIFICHIGMKNQWRNYNLLYPQCYINFAFFLMAKLSLKVGWR